MARVTGSSGREEASESSDEKSKRPRKGSKEKGDDIKGKTNPAGMKNTAGKSNSNEGGQKPPKKKASSSTPLASLGDLNVDLLQPKNAPKNTPKAKTDRSKIDSD